MAATVTYLDVSRKKTLDSEMADEVRDFKAEIESVITEKIQQGIASAGVYDTGLAIVAVDVVDDEITFRWYHTTYDFFSLMEKEHSH